MNNSFYHLPEKKIWAYQGSYDIPALAGWAGAFSSWSSQGQKIYYYFDNDEAGYAAQNALKLNAMLHK